MVVREHYRATVLLLGPPAPPVSIVLPGGLGAAEGAADQSERHRRFGVRGKRIGAPGAAAPPLPPGELAHHTHLHAVGEGQDLLNAAMGCIHCAIQGPLNEE
jgi:hypothetical protein